jgi:hypothetical protein
VKPLMASTSQAKQVGTQFSLLVAVVLSAILPTAIAQRFFSPDRETELAADRGAGSPVPVPAEEYV